MVILVIMGMFELIENIKDNNNSLDIKYLYIMNCFLLEVSLIYIIKGLLQRLRSALIISVVILSLFVLDNILGNTYFKLNQVLLVYILLSLMIQIKWFKGKSNKMKLKTGIIFLIILVLLNLLLNLIFSISFNDKNVFINLFSLLVILKLNLEPFVFKQEHSLDEKEKVLGLLRKFATNPVSAIILEDDKQYFFSKAYEGVIGYTIVNNIAIVAGEPICRDTNIQTVLEEFKKFCSENSLSICFCQISEKYKSILEECGFIVQEYGKEAIIKLDTYSISGSKTSKIRWANNKMEKMGIKVTEYKPLISRSKIIDNQLFQISDEWLKMKKCGELSFMLGTLSLDKPFDRRYFIACDKHGVILGLIVCFPYKSQKGYFIDITRRRKDAPLGIMEKLTIDICKILKDDKVKELSLGLAPLADIQSSNKIESKIMYICFKFIYKHMNSLYGFKALYDYKKKYNPSAWEPRFIAFSADATIISIGYAIIKAKYHQGIIKMLFNKMKLNKKVEEFLNYIPNNN
jgi:lysylphosphatidylglycerol synthetase-like protein (DUF2156 family)